MHFFQKCDFIIFSVGDGDDTLDTPFVLHHQIHTRLRLIAYSKGIPAMVSDADKMMSKRQCIFSEREVSEYLNHFC